MKIKTYAPLALVVLAIGVLVVVGSVMQASAQTKAQETRTTTQQSQPDKVRANLAADSPWQQVSDEQVRTAADSMCTYARQTNRSEALGLIANAYQGSSNPNDNVPTVTAEQARELVGSLMDAYCPDVK